MVAERITWQSEDIDTRLVDSYSFWNLSAMSSDIEDQYVENMANERGWEDDWTKFGITANLDTKNLAEEWGEIICGILNKNPKGVKIECGGGYSPKEYNYMTDSFDFVFEAVGEFEKNPPKEYILEKGLEYAQDKAALDYLRTLAKQLLEDDTCDMYWEAHEQITDWIYEHITSWDWRGVEYNTLDELGDDIEKFHKLEADGAEYDDLPKPMKWELAGKYLDEKCRENTGEGAGWGELIDPWKYVSEAEVAEHYSGIHFVADDF